jgi:hypothetical protein
LPGWVVSCTATSCSCSRGRPPRLFAPANLKCGNTCPQTGMCSLSMATPPCGGATAFTGVHSRTTRRFQTSAQDVLHPRPSRWDGHVWHWARLGGRTRRARLTGLSRDNHSRRSVRSCCGFRRSSPPRCGGPCSHGATTRGCCASVIFTETSPSPRLGRDHWASDPYSLLVAGGQKDLRIRRPHAPGLTGEGCPRSVDPETASSDGRHPHRPRRTSLWNGPMRPCSPLLTTLSRLLSRGHCLLRMNDTSVIVHPSLSHWDAQIHLPRKSPP